jgi:lipid II:glycine glycyltransferase (peptidoglycan interpeptide bridge formation enzyme)
MYTSTNQPDPIRWDEFVNQHPQGHFLQTAAWGEIKAAFGWEVQQIALSDAKGVYAIRRRQTRLCSFWSGGGLG